MCCSFVLRTFAIVMLGITLPLFSSTANADIVDGFFAGTTPNMTIGSTTFNLTAAEISSASLDVDFDVIDDGVEVRVNGTPLFISLSPHQFGPTTDFQIVGYDDIQNPWNPNQSGLPRLNVLATSSGTDFSGAVTVSATSTVQYIPNFDVANFTELLNEGSNTIEFVNHNGSDSAELIGNFKVAVAVPEPSSFLGLMMLGNVLVFRRRRVA